MDKSPRSVALINSLQRRQLKIINWIHANWRTGRVHLRVRGGSGRVSGRRRGSCVAAPGATSETLFVAATSARSSWMRSVSYSHSQLSLSSESSLLFYRATHRMHDVGTTCVTRGEARQKTASRLLLLCELSKQKFSQIDRLTLLLLDAGDNFYPFSLPLTSLTSTRPDCPDRVLSLITFSACLVERKFVPTNDSSDKRQYADYTSVRSITQFCNRWYTVSL